MIVSCDYQKWNGFRLCAIDGSQIRLPNEEDVVHHFGAQKGKHNQADCPMGLASVYFDVLNHIAIDSSLNPTHASERQCAALHLEKARKDDLVIYDGGYNAFWLYALHNTRNLAFCMRAKVNQGLAFKGFVASGKKQIIITLYPNKTSIQQCEEKQVQSRATKMHHYVYRGNFAQALSKMKHTLIALIQQAAVGVKALIEQTIHYIAMTFEPQIIKKYQTSVSDEIETRILSMYGRGLSYTDISEHVHGLYRSNQCDNRQNNRYCKSLATASTGFALSLCLAGRNSLQSPGSRLLSKSRCLYRSWAEY